MGGVTGSERSPALGLMRRAALDFREPKKIAQRPSKAEPRCRWRSKMYEAHLAVVALTALEMLDIAGRGSAWRARLKTQACGRWARVNRPAKR